MLLLLPLSCFSRRRIFCSYLRLVLELWARLAPTALKPSHPLNPLITHTFNPSLSPGASLSNPKCLCHPSKQASQSPPLALPFLLPFTAKFVQEEFTSYSSTHCCLDNLRHLRLIFHVNSWSVFWSLPSCWCSPSEFTQSLSGDLGATLYSPLSLPSPSSFIVITTDI